MIFNIECQAGEREVVQGGKRSFNKVSLRMMGTTIKLILPERFVPDWIEGREVSVKVELCAGRWGVPDLRILGVTAK